MSILNTLKNQIDLLFIPPITNPVFEEQAQNFIPVGLLALLASLKENGFNAKVYQPKILLIGESDCKKVSEDILLFSAKAIGFSTWCHSYPTSLAIAQEIKKNDPDIPIIFGGPQASAVAIMTMQNFKFVDYLLIGEADTSLWKLLDEILINNKRKLDTIDGLYYRLPGSSKKIVYNNRYSNIENLNDLPIPKYEENITKKYISIDVGRGCPFQCTYCSTNIFFSKKYRVKKVDRVLKEIEYCNTNFRSKWFNFSHDMISVNHEFMHELCSQISEYFENRKQKFGWTCSARIDCVSGDLIDSLSMGGCSGIFFGIESGSKRVQKIIKKRIDLKKARKMIFKSTKLGIYTVVSYIIGFPFETRNDINATLKSVLEMIMLGAFPQISALAVLPGTPLYFQYKDSLKFDGLNSEFVDIITPSFLKETIKNNPDIFSSFFYLENKFVSRSTILFICNLINQLNSFVPTLVAINKYLERDYRKYNLLELLEMQIPKYSEKYIKFESELFFLFDAIKNYLLYLRAFKLPLYCWSVFQADYTKAFVLFKYNKWQTEGINKKAQTKVPGIIFPNNRIEVLPIWQLVRSEFYIYPTLVNPIKNVGSFIPRRGEYYYLIRAISDRETSVLKIPKKLSFILMDLTDMSVKEFVSRCYPNFNENNSLQILKRLLKLELVKVLN